MSKIVDEFENICAKHRNKKAFFYLKSNKIVSKSFGDLDRDVGRLVNVLLSRGLGLGQRVLVFVPPSYDLIVFMIACMKLGVSLMYVDVWAGKNLIHETLRKYDTDYVVVSKKTIFLKLAFKDIRRIKTVLIVDKLLNEPAKLTCDYDRVDENTISLLTMTTGSTGKPKFAIRTHEDLYNQLELINDNMENEPKNLVLTTAFMYSFANILKGFTTVLPKINLGFPFTYFLNIKLKKFSSLPITTIITTPDFCLRTNNYYKNLRRLYVGGAILNYNEAKKIRRKYSSSNISYIYGATECNLIAMTDLSDYIKVLEQKGVAVLGRAVKGVKIQSDDKNEIMVNAKAILKDYLSSNRENSFIDEKGLFWHKMGDAGILKNSQLYYLGRSDVYVKGKNGKTYSNPIEQKLVMKFRKVKKCAFFYYRGKNYLFFEGTTIYCEDKIRKYLSSKGFDKNLEIYQNYNIPCDRKHHTKIDYKKIKTRLSFFN